MLYHSRAIILISIIKQFHNINKSPSGIDPPKSLYQPNFNGCWNVFNKTKHNYPKKNLSLEMWKSNLFEKNNSLYLFIYVTLRYEKEV